MTLRSGGSLAEVIDKASAKFRYGLATQWLQNRLNATGVRIVPFYFVLEVEDANVDNAEYSSFDACLLSNGDMAQLNRVDNRRKSTAELVKRLDSGCMCFALKAGSQIAAFSWVNVKECQDKMMHFALARNEAYLYDMHTMKSFRGKDLAVCLRRHVYRALSNEGRTRFYSISERFNRPSLRFKEKLGAKILMSCLYVGLSHFGINLVLRDYSGVPVEQLPPCIA